MAHDRQATISRRTELGVRNFRENIDGSDLTTRIAPCFGRVETRQQALGYVAALRAEKGGQRNGWQIARSIGDAAPWRTQRLLNRARWDADAVRDVLRDYVVEQIGDPAAVVAVGELAMIKKGDASAGVAQQFDTTTQRVQNCQVGVFAAYISRHGRALIDRSLYLPQVWVNGQERRSRAGIPDGLGAASKPVLAAGMVRRALAAGTPFAWVTGDAWHGCDARLRRWLTGQRLGYLLSVPATQPLVLGRGLQVMAGALAGKARSRCRELRLEPGGGSWATVQVELPGEGAAFGFEHVLLVRWGGREPQCHLAHAPERTPLPELIRVLEARRELRSCLNEATEEAGLDGYEVRTWTAWHRHVTLALIAVAPGRRAEAVA
ncbi:IS701 family transposase [Nonomuraea sp. NPDC050404]|uniref:IS701 family transposase n=1 Tax=Nonomuraea sp. NPDC050404 TaxID=3155783 RepID=UPI0033EB3548